MADDQSSDDEFSAQVADSLRRQIAEVKKLLDAQRKLNRGKELELQKSNERLKAVWVIKVLRFQKDANDAQARLEESRKKMQTDLQLLYNYAQIMATRLKLRQQDRIALVGRLDQILTEGGSSWQDTSPIGFFEGSGHSAGDSSTQLRPTALLGQQSSPHRSVLQVVQIQHRVAAHLAQLKLHDFEGEMSSCQPTALDQQVSGVGETMQDISSISFCNPQNSFQNSTFQENSDFPWLSLSNSNCVVGKSESSAEDLSLLSSHTTKKREKTVETTPVTITTKAPKTQKKSCWQALCCCLASKP
jgi:hypothetical protein